MKKNQTTKDLVFLLATGLITAVVWAGFDIYRSYTKVVPPSGMEALLTPIDPQLQTSVLDDLEQLNP